MEKHYTESETKTFVIDKYKKADRLGLEIYKPLSRRKGEKKNGQTHRRPKS